MKNVAKYTRQYFPAPVSDMKWTKKNYIDKAPIWCSVDLRDGNQSLISPMNLQEKLEFFHTLVDCGVKGFWNFSHYDILNDYPDVVVENVHMGDSLMTLSYRMTKNEE